MRQIYYAFFMLATLAHAQASELAEAPGKLEIYTRAEVEGKAVKLSEEEWKWLRAKGEFTVGISDPDYRPFDITISSTHYEGISADVTGAISKLLGVHVVVRKYPDRSSAIEALKSGEIDLLPSANGFDVSDASLILSQPYAPDKPAIFSRLNDMRDFSKSVKGLHIAVPYDYLSPGVLRNNYEDAYIEPYRSRQEALAALAFGRADLYLGDALSANLLINENYFNYIKIESLVDLDARGTGYAIRKNNSILIGVVNKAIREIGASELRDIIRRWAGGTRAFSPVRVTLTESEKRWIAKHPVVRVAISVDQAPVAFVDTDGNFSGIASDILKSARIETGIRFEPVYVDKVGELQELILNQGAELAILSSTSEREEFLRFTDDFYVSPFAIVVNSTNKGVIKLEQLFGKAVAIPRGHVIIGRLQKDYPDIKIIETANLMEALTFVSEGRAAATITPLSVLRYYLGRITGYDLSITNVLDAGSAKFPFAMERSNTELQSILDKVIVSIPPDELNVIGNRWRANPAVKVKTWKDFRPLILQIIGVGLLLLGVSLIWNAYLRRQIAQRRQAEDALNEQLQLMQALINGTPHPIYVRDQLGRLVSCNSHYLRALDRTYEQVIGRLTFESAKMNRMEAEGLHEDYMEVMRTSVPIEMDRPLHLKSKVTTIYHWIYPYKSTSGEVQGVICGWVDISERRRLMEELKRAKDEADAARDEAYAASRAKTTFLATMSHEIRTPMNAIIGLLELALLGVKEGHLDSSQIEIAHDSALSLLDLIGDILDIARIESGNLTISPRRSNIRQLSEAVLRVFDGLAMQKNLSLKFHFNDAVDCDVLVDPVRYKQILSNLIGNSIKFTEKGSVDVSVFGVARDGAEVKVEVTVRDSGIGISDADQVRIFEPFEQATEQEGNVRGGTGLGLAICRSLAEMMGGSLDLKSRLGVGTSVVFNCALTILESAQEDSSVEGRDEISAKVTVGTLKVLVVDDNPANRLVLSQQLVYLGHNVISASNGVEALRIWLEQNFDILITDCNMPLMNGYSLAREIREEEARLGGNPAIIIGFTANAQPEETQRCLDAGMNGCLFKPVAIENLDICLRKWVGGKVNESGPEFGTSRETSNFGDLFNLTNLEKITRGDSFALSEILKAFMKSNSDDINEVKILCRSGDLKSIAETVHRVKGGAKAFESRRLIRACEMVEAQCKGGHSDIERLLNTVDAMEHEILFLESELEKFLAGGYLKL